MSSNSRIIPEARRAVARHAVRDHIAMNLNNGTYTPGSKLVQQKLASELGISRAVVREALSELHGMGLIKMTDQRGAMIEQFDKNKFLESLEIREVLEGLTARRCCERIAVQQLRELRAMVDDIYRLRKEGQCRKSSRLDREFHLRLLKIADSGMLERLSDTCSVLSKCIVVGLGDAKETLDDHSLILNEIQAGRPDAAEEAARVAVRRARVLIENHTLEELQLQWII